MGQWEVAEEGTIKVTNESILDANHNLIFTIYFMPRSVARLKSNRMKQKQQRCKWKGKHMLHATSQRLRNVRKQNGQEVWMKKDGNCKLRKE